MHIGIASYVIQIVPSPPPPFPSKTLDVIDEDC